MTSYRPARTSDIPAIDALDNDVTAMHQRAWPHLFTLPTTRVPEVSSWTQAIEAADSAVFVAEASDEVVGFVLIKMLAEGRPLLQPMRFAAVPSLAVAEGRRGKGIGSQLMALAENWARGEGAEEIRLTVWDFNDAAARMYAGLGYETRTRALGKRLARGGA